MQPRTAAPNCSLTSITNDLLQSAQKQKSRRCDICCQPGADFQARLCIYGPPFVIHSRSPLLTVFLTVTAHKMRILVLSAIILNSLITTVHADCRHPNGNVQTDGYHAPCAEVLGNPLNTMCCAIERSNPSEGLSSNGLTADVCLPNGLCKLAWREDENSTMSTRYWREECTVDGWKNGRCLSVCLTNSVRA